MTHPSEELAAEDNRLASLVKVTGLKYTESVEVGDDLEA